MQVTRKAIQLKCSGCQRVEVGQLHFAGFGIFDAEWIQPPAGWWVLLACKDPHARCPECLGPSEKGDE